MDVCVFVGVGVCVCVCVCLCVCVCVYVYIPTLEPTAAGEAMHSKHSLLGEEGERSIRFEGTMYTYSESQAKFGAILPPSPPPPGLALPFPSPRFGFCRDPASPPLSHTLHAGPRGRHTGS